MSTDLPPSIDPVAARRWDSRAQTASAWLHDEVGRRMEERLQWIRRQPQAWIDWDPVRGGLATHAALTRRYPAAACTVVEPAAPVRSAAKTLHQPWWNPARWSAVRPSFAEPAPAQADMLWANMALHMAADPRALLVRWHELLAPEGFLMFSCLGPDSLRELRAVYASLGWPSLSHDFTDMHDWGDMLVHNGFAEPVLDMERIVLSFDGPERALRELRELGRNLHPARAPGLRGRRWRGELLSTWSASRPVGSEGVQLTFEVIYGHALKAQPRVRVQERSAVPLDDMREMLRRGRRDASDGPG